MWAPHFRSVFGGGVRTAPRKDFGPTRRNCPILRGQDFHRGGIGEPRKTGQRAPYLRPAPACLKSDASRMRPSCPGGMGGR